MKKQRQFRKESARAGTVTISNGMVHIVPLFHGQSVWKQLEEHGSITNNTEIGATWQEIVVALEAPHNTHVAGLDTRDAPMFDQFLTHRIHTELETNVLDEQWDTAQ